MDSRFLSPIQTIYIILPVLVAFAHPPSVLAQSHAVSSSESTGSEIELPERTFPGQALFERLFSGRTPFEQLFLGQTVSEQTGMEQTGMEQTGMEQTGVEQSTPVLTSITFTPPPDDGEPATNQAGGRRDQLCDSPIPMPSFTLLMPPSNQGKTLAPHPTLWAYVPPVAAQTIFLKLEDEQGNYLFHTIFPISDYSGLLGLPIPTTAPELGIGDRVKVSLALTCAAVIDPSDPILESWITRVPPSSASISAPTSAPTHDELSIEQAQWYADNGIWFDALTVLALLRQEQPNQSDIHTAWETFLHSVDLEAFAGVDIVGSIDSE